MHKILLGLVMFLLCWTIKEKVLDKAISDRLKKELGKASKAKDPKDLAKRVEKAIAVSAPDIYKQNKAKIKKGVKKIAEASEDEAKFAKIKSDGARKKVVA